MFASAQCRAAHALLGWSGDRLATRTVLDKTDLNCFEAGDLALSPQGQAVLKRVLEEAGAVFFDGGLH